MTQVAPPRLCLAVRLGEPPPVTGGPWAVWARWVRHGYILYDEEHTAFTPRSSDEIATEIRREDNMNNVETARQCLWFPRHRGPGRLILGSRRCGRRVAGTAAGHGLKVWAFRIA